MQDEALVAEADEFDMLQFEEETLGFRPRHHARRRRSLQVRPEEDLREGEEEEEESV